MIKVAESISKVTLWQFKMVMNSNDVRYLLILDDYDELPEYDMEVLNNLWITIYAEFSEIVGGNRADLWLLKQKQLMFQKMKYEMDASFLRVIQVLPHPELVEQAKEFGYVINLSDFQNTFAKANGKLTRLKHLIERTVKEMEGKQEQPQDFDALIITLEKHQGYQFDEYTMTVKKFASIYKSYKAKQNG